MSRVRLGVIVFTAAAALAVAGCASAATDQAAAPTGVSTVTPEPASTSSSGSASPGPVVPDALRFTARTVGGGQFDAATLAGKPAVLWFWAAWCPRCRAKAADVKAVQSEHAGKVAFVGVAGLGSGDGAMARFVEEHSLGAFVHLADDAGAVWRRFGVTEQEFFVVLDATGTIVHKGPLSRDELRRRVVALAG